jgi:hypothetical protein
MKHSPDQLEDIVGRSVASLSRRGGNGTVAIPEARATGAAVKSSRVSPDRMIENITSP